MRTSPALILWICLAVVFASFLNLLNPELLRRSKGVCDDGRIRLRSAPFVLGDSADHGQDSPMRLNGKRAFEEFRP